MTETKTPGDKTLSVSKTLTLKRPSEQGVVRQSFSHGRTKAVVVEKVKRRSSPGETGGGTAPSAPAKPGPSTTPLSTKPRVGGPPASPSAGTRPSGVVLRTLTEEERDARTQALQEARIREAEERRAAEEEARRRVEREAKERVEREAAEARKREEDARRVAEDEARRKAEQEARKRFGEEEAARRSAAAAAPSGQAASSPQQTPGSPRPSYRSGGGAGAPRPAGSSAGGPRPGPGGAPAIARPGGAPAGRPGGDEEEEARKVRRPGGGGPAKPAIPPKAPKATPGEEKRRGRLTVVTAYQEGEQRERSVAAFRRRVQRMTGHRQSETKEKISREVVIPETITIADLANRMSERAVDVIRMLMRQGQMVKINDVIDADTAQLIAEELGHTVKRVSEADVEEGLFDAPDDPDDAGVAAAGGHHHGPRRPRQDLAARRHPPRQRGGGRGRRHHPAHRRLSGDLAVRRQGHLHRHARPRRLHGDARPRRQGDGHRGAGGGGRRRRDAADHRGHQPRQGGQGAADRGDQQDRQARRQARAGAHRAAAARDRGRTMGGDTLEVEVSAKQKINLDKLLEAINLQAEVLDLKANPERAAEGTVIEAKLDRGRGPVATVLVQRGTLQVGDIVVAGAEWGRVRALVNDTGTQVETAGPSFPVEVLGFNGTPEAGDRARGGRERGARPRGHRLPRRVSAATRRRPRSPAAARSPR